MHIYWDLPKSKQKEEEDFHCGGVSPKYLGIKGQTRTTTSVVPAAERETVDVSSIDAACEEGRP